MLYLGSVIAASVSNLRKTWASNTHENSFKSSLSASINLHVKPASFHFPGNLLGSILPVTSISEITNDVNASSELGLAGGIKTLSNVSKSQKYIEIP